MLQTIEGLLIVGLLVGLLIGLALGQRRFGCWGLLIVPIAMIVYISWWHGQHPEAIRSTSGLDFVFGPLWPSLGAVPAFFLGIWIKSKLTRSE